MVLTAARNVTSPVENTSLSSPVTMCPASATSRVHSTGTSILMAAMLSGAIRRDAREGLSGRQIQRKHGVSYRTVRQAFRSACRSLGISASAATERLTDAPPPTPNP
jgi:hypothetical protein